MVVMAVETVPLTKVMSMGIRCWCPNGHKLNIKAFQAGKRGICPYCGARFTIPLESTRKPGMGDRIPEPMEHSVHEGPVLSPPTGPGPTPPASSPTAPAEPIPFLSAPIPLGTAPDASAGLGAEGAVSAEGGGAWGAAFGQQAAPAWASAPMAPAFPMGTEGAIPPPSLPGILDPLAEAPNAVWYVRPPTGGQFGPAPADLMRNWIAEGRVSPDSLVWREGWRDWQEAGQVFPQLTSSPPFPSPAGGTSESAKPSPRKKTTSNQNVWLLVLLVLAVAVLLGVFLYVAFWMPGAPPASGS
jgi:hypothetical protein